jgi:putative FmdB family regulatory protein
MPIYEYECEACNKRVEYIQSFSDAPKTTCEHCGGKLSRVISPSGFILKGGGWYKDLYSKKPGGSSSSETKVESKPDKKD